METINVVNPKPSISYCKVNHRNQNRLAGLFVVGLGYCIDCMDDCDEVRITEDVDLIDDMEGSTTQVIEVTKEELLIIPLSPYPS